MKNFSESTGRKQEDKEEGWEPFQGLSVCKKLNESAGGKQRAAFQGLTVCNNFQYQQGG